MSVLARRRPVLWIAVVILLAGCTASPRSNSGEPSQKDLTWLHQHARDVLARFDKTVADAGGSPIVVLEDLSESEQDIRWGAGDAAKQRAYAAGLVASATALPKAPHPTGKVIWDTGVTLTVPLISAGAALTQLAAEGGGTCPGCAPLEATGATFTVISQIPTTRGTATLPAWEFTFKGTQFRVLKPAISISSIVHITPMPWESINLPGQPSPLPIVSATTSASSRQLTVTFVGAKGPGSQVCGMDYTAEAVESEYAVAVIVIEQANNPPPGRHLCTMIGYSRTAVVDLAHPLGDRTVLEIQRGLPVPVAIAP